MKRLSNLLAALVFASLVIFMSCGGGGGDDTPPDVRVEIADNLTISGGWDGATITTDGQDPDGNWNDFTLTFSGGVDGGSYTVTGAPAEFESVWENGTGTWAFGNSTGTEIIRTRNGVNTTMSLTVTDNSLTLEFTVPEPARASNIGGLWRFTF